MTIDLKRVQVTGLFDNFKLDVPIKDNTLILVGENGSGKSTLINIIYYALTAQWDRLVELQFTTCTITIGEEDYQLERQKLLNYKKTSKRNSQDLFHYLERRISTHELSNLIDLIAEYDSKYWSTLEGRRELMNIRDAIPRLRNVPFEALIELAESRIYARGKSIEDEENSVSETLAKVLKSSRNEQFLFLPTYRRIEKELSDVFPDLNLEETTSTYSRNLTNKKQSAFIELVEFGMTDVARVFKSTLTALDQTFRSELNRFTGSYLHNILQGLYEDVDASLLATDEVAETVDLMLSRIGEEILSGDDRKKLRSLLADVGSSQILTEAQRISAYFLTNLVMLHQKQQEREIPVRKLVELVNQYLSNKKLKFNPTVFELIVKRTDTDDSCEIPLYGLSSGEKQIVSLFTHVFLSAYQKYFVVIDEPELSISVPWQRRFLQDLKETEKCSGLIAVTHSPFVFENSLSEYAHSISEFVSEN